MSVYLNDLHLEHKENIYLTMINEVNMYTFIMIIDGVLPEDCGILTFAAGNELAIASVQSKLCIAGAVQF